MCAGAGISVIEMSIGLEGLRELTLPAVYRRFEQEIVVKEAKRTEGGFERNRIGRYF